MKNIYACKNVSTFPQKALNVEVMPDNTLSLITKIVLNLIKKRFLTLLIFTVAFCLPINSDGQNLIYNGDFEQGDTGYSTNYLNDGANGPDHIVVQDGNFPIWEYTEDHTTGKGGNGYLMLIDGPIDYDNNNIAWEQQVYLTPGNYVFTYWAKDISPTLPCRSALGYKFDGTINNESGNLTTTWQPYSYSITVTDSSYHTFAFYSSGLGWMGNDFALDDIGLIRCDGITTQPAGTIVCTGSGTTLSITASSASSYQWQWYNGNSWENVFNYDHDSTTYSGEATSDLQVYNIKNKSLYRCVVATGCGTIFSNTAIVDIYAPVLTPTVSIVASADTTQPGQITYTATRTDSFGCVATFQWMNNGVDIPGDTSQTYATTIPVNCSVDLIKCRITIQNCFGCSTTIPGFSNEILTKPSKALYWFGGSGNWSDASHWSFDSLAPRGPNSCGAIPDESNNVYFDENSGFTAGNETVTVDIEYNVMCKNMDWTGAGNTVTPIFDLVNSIEIHGSLTLIPDMTFNCFAPVYFKAATTGNTITSAGRIFDNVSFDGTGEWTLQDSLSALSIYYTAGTLNTNDKNISCVTITADVSDSKVWNLGSSVITLSGDYSGITILAGDLTINPGTSIFRLAATDEAWVYVSPGVNSNMQLNDIEFTNSSSYNGKLDNNSNYHLIMNNVSFAGDGVVNGSNIFQGALTLAGGKTYLFQEYTTQYFDSTATIIIAGGSCANKAIIKAVYEYSEAIFYKSGAPLNINYVSLWDIQADGAIPFIANYSDAGRYVSGWSVLTPSVSIATSPGTHICIGTGVTFTASPANETTPVYQWELNGSIVGSDQPTYTNASLSDNDVVSCIMTSSTHSCQSLSNVNMVVEKISIQPDDTIHACPGLTYYITNLTVVNGVSLFYQWQYNNGTNWVNVGDNVPAGASYGDPHQSVLQLIVPDGIFHYRCLITDAGSGCTDPMISNTVTVAPVPIKISLQPINDTVFEGGDALFIVSASGNLYAYGWQMKTSSFHTWDNTYFINDAPPYYGVWTDTLRISPVTLDMNGNIFRCHISGTCDAIYSNEVTLIIINCPGIVRNNLFWMGGSGNWSDPNHWSLDSLPPRQANPCGLIPSSLKNVFFDANSGFTNGDDTVTVDANALCRNMDWTGADNITTPVFNHTDINNNLSIYGSLTLIPNMSFNCFGPVHFSASTTGNTITSAGNTFNEAIWFDGTGEWSLMDSLISNGEIDASSGTFNTNDKNITVLYGFYFNPWIWPDSKKCTVNLGSSIITTSYFEIYHDSLVLNAGTSIIRLVDNWTGIDASYAADDITMKKYVLNNVEFANASGSGYVWSELGTTQFIINSCTFAGNGAIYGNNTFKDLTFAAGKDYSFCEGGTDTITGTWSLPGQADSNINIRYQGWDTYLPAAVYKSSGCVLGDWLHIDGVNVTGGAKVFAGDPTHSDTLRSLGWNLAMSDSKWLGYSNDWFTPSNWDLNGAIPNYSTSVRLTSCYHKQIIIDSAGAYCDSLFMEPGTSVTLSDTNSINIYSYWGITAGATFTPNQGTVNIVDDAELDVDEPLQVHNINIEAAKSLTMTGDDQLMINGNFTNNGDFYPDQSKIIFNGDEHQLIDLNGDAVYDVEFNNSDAGFADLSLLNDMTVEHNAALINGVINVTSGKSLIIASGASCNEGNDNSYVDGAVTKQGDEAFTFPLGDSSIWAPAGIDAPENSSEITAQYYFSVPPTGGMTAGLDSVSPVEYWDLSSTGSYPNVTLYWENGTRSGISNISRIGFAHGEIINASLNWVHEMSVTGGTVESGWIKSSNLTSYGPLTLGYQSVSPLPVKLLDVKAVCDGQEVTLEWWTATELNNDYFSVQRSVDLANWENAATIAGAGNSDELRHYTWKDDFRSDGNIWYRLIQVDYDGARKMTDPVLVVCNDNDNALELSVFPNPSSGNFTIMFNVKNYASGIIEISDVSGNIIKRITLGDKAVETYDLNLDGLAAGTYLLDLKSESHVFRKLLFKL